MSVLDLKAAFALAGREKEPFHNVYPAVMISVAGSVTLAQQPNYVWVSQYGLPESQHAVFNDTCLPMEGLPVLVGIDPKPPYRERVICINHNTHEADESVTLAPYSIGPHAQAHQYPSEPAVGDDVVLVYQPALQMLKTIAVAGTLSVSVYPYVYSFSGVGKEFKGQTLDLTASQPSAGKVRKVLVGLDRNLGSITTIDGTAVADNGAVPIPLPAAPDDMVLSAYVKMYNQASLVTADDIQDIRDFLSFGGGTLTYLAQEVGQVLYSENGYNYETATPLTNDGGWMVNDDGILLIV